MLPHLRAGTQLKLIFFGQRVGDGCEYFYADRTEMRAFEIFGFRSFPRR